MQLSTSLSRTLGGVAAGAAMLLAASAANAATVTYSVVGTSGGQPVNAQALVTTSLGAISVTLTNNQTNIISASQAISGVTFTLSGAPGTLGDPTVTGTFVNANGTTDSVTNAPAPTNRWDATASSNTITLTTLTGGQPAQMIVGPAPYNFNNGIDNFNPYLQTTATFNFTASGITEATTLSSLSFLFGTGPDVTLPGTTVPNPTPGVPEPATMALFGAALGLFGVASRRRRRA